MTADASRRERTTARQTVLVVRLGDVYGGQDRNDPRHVIHACSHKLRTRENARLRRRQDRGSLTTEYEASGGT
jgi:hypothetical protein